MNKIIKYFLHNRVITLLILAILTFWGMVHAPFDWDMGIVPNDPVSVDAIPDIGENQQIVFTDWPGRSPQDIEDQITYPLTSTLLGLPGVKSIRSTSMFGFSSIYIIFDEEIEFYWSRARLIEKLNALPPNLLPDGVTPALGPDATALGQVFWYTLEGRDAAGKVTGGWDFHELRSIQDYYVKYALTSAEGVSEVASIGGHIKEYQIDINPDALRAYGIGLDMVMMAIQNSNRDIGANTIEINKVEYIIRGLGYIKSIEDIENTVVRATDNKPILIRDVAKVNLGPAERRGVLDKGGAETVGGVVVARYGSNPLQVINNVKDKIDEISKGLPNKTLADGTKSQLTIVPFYDRTQLIKETIATLEDALTHEILISIIVIIVLVVNLRASVIISGLLPVAVLMTFIVMKYTGVEANIVALSGIAIAIGVIVDVGIVFTENIIRHLEMPQNIGAKGKHLLNVIYEASTEIAMAVTTALATTVISFLPVLFMEEAEGKLFRPLAFTKTFALSGSFILGILILPTLAYIFFSIKSKGKGKYWQWPTVLMVTGIALAIYFTTKLPLAIAAVGGVMLLLPFLPQRLEKWKGHIVPAMVVLLSIWVLTATWMPIGVQHHIFTNFLFVVATLGIILLALWSMVYFYTPILTWCLNNKKKFLLLPLITVLIGANIWLGFSRIFGGIASGFDHLNINIRTTSVWSALHHTFPGLGNEFMPNLNEGSFLLMPTSMPHSGVEENIDIVALLDIAIENIPEVELAVGKIGRVESALDPAPISMYENLINYKPEYMIDAHGRRGRYKVDSEGNFILANGEIIAHRAALQQRISQEQLVADDDGQYFRNWRPEIKSPNDIWDEIIKVTKLPGVTSAPKLQPIETRLVMLQTGMRAPMGIKVYGPDLQTIQDFSLELEQLLTEVPGVKKEAVFADRIVGKPYLELKIDRLAIARYGLSIEQLQQTIESAVGGMPLTTTVEGRERYQVRLRYPRELRNDPERIKSILVPTPAEISVPLGQLVDIQYRQGPQMIRSEETFLVGYVLFDKQDGQSEVTVVESAKRYIEDRISSGELSIPQGVSYKFAGNYENQVRAMQRLSIVIPLCLLAIFLLLYFQFNTVTAATIHFSGVFVAFAGGFILIWLYGQPWFMDIQLGDINLRELFQIKPINLSVAVWVGFIALFGIATDDGVLMGTYIHQVFEAKKPATVAEVRAAVLEAGQKRVRPAMMTTALTIIALLPVLTSTGKGSDIMIPMAIPTFGGMIVQIMTIFVVPVFQAIWRENAIKAQKDE